MFDVVSINIMQCAVTLVRIAVPVGQPIVLISVCGGEAEVIGMQRQPALAKTIRAIRVNNRRLLRRFILRHPRARAERDDATRSALSVVVMSSNREVFARSC